MTAVFYTHRLCVPFLLQSPSETHRTKKIRMMQIDSTRHTIDYWICINHSAHLCRFPLCLGVNAQSGHVSVTQHVCYGIILSYIMKKTKQSEYCVLCQMLRLWLWVLVITNIRLGSWQRLTESNSSPGAEHKPFNYWKHGWWVQSLITWPSLVRLWAIVTPRGAIWHL